MERFYPLFDFSTQLLCELFADACKVGKLLVEYDKPGEEGSYEIPNFPMDEIFCNISSGCHTNYFVYMKNHEDWPDGIRIGMPLLEPMHTTAYVDMDISHLDWFVEKYKLIPQPDEEISAAESLIMDFEFKRLREPSSLN
ncbi:hypothetical protein FACS1894155_04550 [Bacteroidia bacterium]|nr:hypothetical protein FACS1894155_04550 [Bacteroidia bacterium]